MNSLSIGRVLLCMMAAIMLMGASETCPDSRAIGGRTARSISLEVQTANGRDRKAAYDQYISLFDPAAKVHGLVPGRAATIDDVRRHYHAVFFDLEGGTLVEDDRIIAGEIGAHRYHSLLTLNGTFDGVEARNKPVVLRGQTFFKIAPTGKIVERWSNHDHAYRMGQLLAEKGRIEGSRIAKELNGPGLSEEQGYVAIEAFRKAFSRAEAPELRRTETATLIADSVIVHGLGCQSLGKAELMDHFDALWTAFPDLHMKLAGEPMSGWSMVAFRWQARSSQRRTWQGRAPGYRAIATWSGEAIAQLDQEGRIVELWLNERPVVFDN